MTHRSISLLASLAALVACLTTASEARADRYYYRHAARPHSHHRPHTYYRPHARVVSIYPRGLYFGGGLAATSILSQRGGAELLESGAGLSLHAGWRISHNVALEGGWIGTFHNPAEYGGNEVDYLVLNGLTADAKIYFNTSTPRMEPFIQGGVGVYLLDSTYVGTESVGTGFQLGGGFDYKAGEHAALGLRALYRGISMGPPDSDEDDTFVNALTIEGNLSLRF